jgi:hypothetical protein
MEHPRLIRELNDRRISYLPIYRDATGSITAAVLLSQIMYWYNQKMRQTKDTDGTFWHTDEQFLQETRLTPNELRSAKKRLKKLPFLSVTRKGIPPRTFFTIDFDEYREFMEDVCFALTEGEEEGEIHELEDETQFVKSTQLNSLNSLNLKDYIIHIKSKYHSCARGGASKSAGDDNRWNELAISLRNAMAASRKVNCNSKVSVWAKEIRRIHTTDKVPIKRLERVLHWYCHQLESGLGKYTPIAYSGKAFREKYLRIESAMERSAPPPKEKITPKQERRGKLLQDEIGQDLISLQDASRIAKGVEDWLDVLSLEDNIPQARTRRLYQDALDPSLLFSAYGMWIRKELEQWGRGWAGDVGIFLPSGKRHWQRFLADTLKSRGLNHKRLEG